MSNTLCGMLTEAHLARQLNLLGLSSAFAKAVAFNAIMRVGIPADAPNQADSASQTTTTQIAAFGLLL